MATAGSASAAWGICSTAARRSAPRRSEEQAAAVAACGGCAWRLQDRLDVDDRGAVERLDRADAQAGAVDRADRDRVQADRVGAIRRAGGEHAGERVAAIRARVNL